MSIFRIWGIKKISIFNFNCKLNLHIIENQLLKSYKSLITTLAVIHPKIAGI